MIDLLHRLRNAGEESLRRTLNGWIEPDLWFNIEYRPIITMDRLLRQIAWATEMDIVMNYRLQNPIKD
jgi:hypothetical protein